MRYRSAFLWSALALSTALTFTACSSDDSDDDSPGSDGGQQYDSSSGGSAGSGGTDNGDGQAGDAGASDASDAGAGGDAGMVAACTADELPQLADGGTDGGGVDGGVSGAPRRLLAGAAVPVGVTNSGYVIARENNKISAVPLAGGDAFEVTTTAGTPVVKGSALVHWSNIDYAAGTGDLTIWTGGRCVRQLGRALSADDSVSISSNGAYLLYPTRVSETTFDLVLATKDFATQQVLVSGVGRGSETTCRPKYGFAGARIVVASCAPGSQDASLELFELSAGTWTSKTVSDLASSTWSADANAQRIFYTNSKSGAFVWSASTNESVDLDAGVGWGLMLPAGNALLYTVGDQLRRTALPDIGLIPIVTNKFKYQDAFSPDFSYALYSTNVSYEGGEKRDLLLTRTTSFNPAPTKLVPTLAARLSRSAFTSDSKYAIYLTDLDAQGGGTLHVAPTTGTGDQAIVKVDTAAAAHDSLIVFSDNRSDPATYPITAGLKVVDASLASAPVLLRAKISDGRSFYVTADKSAVVYARPREGTDTSTDGIWLHPLP